MATRKLTYVASSALTIPLASLATSSTLVAGEESDAIDNTTNVYLDYLLSGKITTGTTPTVDTAIEVWVIAKSDDTNWPDVFDGTNSAETVTSRAQLQQYGRMAWVGIVTATSNVAYEFTNVSVAALFGGKCPAQFVVFAVHNTGVNLNATSGNHRITVKPVYETIA